MASIIAAAVASGAQAVHPGYGFLAENADFAQAVVDAGLVWVGPPAAAIRAMGDKAHAKRLMLAAGVSCVPGFDGPEQDDATLIAQGERIGYPLMVKATAGGGGGRGRQMGAMAVAATRAIDYRGAGTIECLLDAQGKFYFMEMNTRLQVEHPVTEALTGFDLIEWQLRVARGEPLPQTAQEIILQRFESGGHAIEVRLCAEDPAHDFLPQSGRLLRWQPGTALLDATPALPPALAALALYAARALRDGHDPTRVDLPLGWPVPMRLQVDGHTHRAGVHACGGNRYAIQNDDGTATLELVTCDAHGATFAVNDAFMHVAWAWDDNALVVSVRGRQGRLMDHSLSGAARADAAHGGAMRAPMAGRIVAMPIAVGQRVRKGELLLVLEAMKMEHPSVAPMDAVVATVRVAHGAQVLAGALLVELMPDKAA